MTPEPSLPPAAGARPEPFVRPGTEDYRVGQGPPRVLLCHGFTGSPWSMRGWADALAGSGFEVSVPRLPGHGTAWTDLNRTAWPDWYARVARELQILAAAGGPVFVGGLSMGAGLALRLAACQPGLVSGLALVNPFLSSADRRMVALPVLRRLVRSLPGVVNDTARPGQDERGYDRLPLTALASVVRLWADLRPRLGEVRAPVVVYTSAVDHVVDTSSAALLRTALGSAELTEVVLPRSYHVATMDYDAGTVFEGSAAFFSRLATGG